MMHTHDCNQSLPTPNISLTELRQTNLQWSERVFSTLRTYVIRELGPSLWALYSQLIRNLIRSPEEWTLHQLSARTLQNLLELHPAVAYRHDDIVSMMRGEHLWKVPKFDFKGLVGTPATLRASVLDEYIHFCDEMFKERVAGKTKTRLLNRMGVLLRSSTGLLESILVMHSVSRFPWLPFFAGPEVFTWKYEPDEESILPQDILDEVKWAGWLREYLET
jgi:hypothetical protein